MTKKITNKCFEMGISKTDYVRDLLVVGDDKAIKEALKIFSKFKMGIPKELANLVGCASEMITNPSWEKFYCESLKVANKNEAVNKAVNELKVFLKVA
jgi:hypothetical protein